MKPPNSFTEMSVEHTHRSIRQWKWRSKERVFSPRYTLKMLVLIDNRKKVKEYNAQNSCKSLQVKDWILVGNKWLST